MTLEPALKRLKNLGKNKRGLRATEARKEIKRIVSACASVVRAEKELTEGLERLDELKRRGISLEDKDVTYALETENIMEAAEMVLRAAALRKESRGPHLYFAHFEDLQPTETKDPEWRKYIVIRKEKGEMKLELRQPVKLLF